MNGRIWFRRCFIIIVAFLLLLGLSFSWAEQQPSVELSGGMSIIWSHWLQTPGYVDLSTVTVREDVNNDQHQRTNDRPWRVGVLVTRSRSAGTFTEFYCCTDEERRQGSCTELNEPFIKYMQYKQKDDKENVLALFSSETLLPEKEIHWEKNQTIINATESGYYFVSMRFCEGSWGTYSAWPKVHLTGLPTFRSTKGGSLSPQNRRYAMYCAILFLVHSALVYVWVLPRIRTRGTGQQTCYTALAVLVLLACEALFRTVDLVYMDRCSVRKTPAMWFVRTAWCTRLGVVTVYVLSLAHGSEMFRRGPWHEPWILAVGVLTVVTSFLAHTIKQWNVVALVTIPVMSLSILAAMVMSRRYLSQSDSITIAHEQVIAYRKTLCGMVLFGLVLPLVYEAVIKTPTQWFDRDLDVMSDLPPWTLDWHTIIFWHANTAWFVCATMRWRYAPSHNDPSCVAAFSRSETINTPSVSGDMDEAHKADAADAAADASCGGRGSAVAEEDTTDPNRMKKSIELV